MTVKITVINNKNQYLKQRDAEKCCVCKLFTPKEIRVRPCLIFTKWLQCDQYKQWVHLVYSTEKRVIRKSDIFLCPYCKSD